MDPPDQERGRRPQLQLRWTRGMSWSETGAGPGLEEDGRGQVGIGTGPSQGGGLRPGPGGLQPRPGGDPGTGWAGSPST